MKNLKLFIIMLFITSQVILAKGNTEASKPIAAFTETSYDFGKVAEGISLEHTYIFINQGDAKLVIQSVQPSCGCTGATMGDKKEFETGETGEIKVSFNTQGRSGVISKSVTVTTNDPANPQVVLTFTCEIEQK
jgi:hypothetical protein